MQPTVGTVPERKAPPPPNPAGSLRSGKCSPGAKKRRPLLTRTALSRILEGFPGRFWRPDRGPSALRNVSARVYTARCARGKLQLQLSG